jgi:hypothetical protein
MLDKILFTNLSSIYCYIVHFCLLLNSIPFGKFNAANHV